jgi:hypothetical protein
MVILVFTEVNKYLNYKVSSELKVDYNHEGEKVIIIIILA